MKKENISIETLSSIARINNKYCQRYIVSNGFVYFINPYKFDNILSLLKLLCEFNDYINCTDAQNITSWIRNKKLNKKEILEEISYYRISCNNADENSLISRFFIFENFIGKKIDFALYLSDYLKEIFKTALLFDFLTKFNLEFNKYFQNICVFFSQNPSYLSANCDYFTDYLLEIDKYKFKNEFKRIENLKITCKIEDVFENNIVLKKSSNSYLFYECLKSNLKLNFEIYQPHNLVNELNLEKYLQILETVNKMRLMQKETIKQPNSNMLVLEKTGKKIITDSNLSFLNKNQIIFMSLNENNKEFLKENTNFVKILVPHYPYELMFPDNMNYAKIKLY